MTPPGRRGRAGERGQGFWEWFVFGSAILAVGTVMTVAVGGWAAATYDQHHSDGPLTSSSTAPPPSLAFVDFSPVGLHEDCIVTVARGLGLTWDGGALGWFAASDPRPRGVDSTDQKVQQWRDRMTALVGGAASSAEWKRCSQPDLGTPAPRSPEPADTLVVDGNYTVDPSGVAGIGGCGSDTGPRAMTVAANGSTVTVFFQGTAQARTTLQGTVSPGSYALDASSTDADGTQHTLRGSFSSNAGVTRFNGTFDTLNGTAGCGYQFGAQKS